MILIKKAQYRKGKCQKDIYQKATKKKLDIKKLKISKKAVIRQKSTMAGCGKSSPNMCGISAKYG
jgi:hypothetical protein